MTQRYSVQVIKATGVHACAYVNDATTGDVAMHTVGPDAVAQARQYADWHNATALPDPTVKGPCQAEATFMCTGEAAGERLIPQSMLPTEDRPRTGPIYQPMCQPCYDHLADAYVATVHGRPS